MNIAPVDKKLTDLIERDLYRELLQEMSNNYETMARYISNLESDISSIETLTRDLQMQVDAGYEVGSSVETLGFQQSQLQTDLDWFMSQRQMYLNKTYRDLFKFAKDISKAAAEIEPRQGDDTLEDMISRKLSGSRDYKDDENYNMADIFGLLTLAERNLIELAADIASFEPKIENARKRQARGFQVGNLVVNLQSQMMKLRTEFESNIQRIKAFLIANKNFSSKCLDRIKMIANEIISQEELEEKQEIEEQVEEMLEEDENSDLDSDDI